MTLFVPQTGLNCGVEGQSRIHLTMSCNKRDEMVVLVAGGCVTAGAGGRDDDDVTGGRLRT